VPNAIESVLSSAVGAPGVIDTIGAVLVGVGPVTAVAVGCTKLEPPPPPPPSLVAALPPPPPPP
jgi:hypothetical protein